MAEGRDLIRCLFVSMVDMIRGPAINCWNYQLDEKAWELARKYVKPSSEDM